MATPPLNAYSLALCDFAGRTIAEYLRTRLQPLARILDVGAGWGKYRFLLPEFEMDAVEIWRPYVEQEKLNQYYRDVFVEDIVDFVDYGPSQRYDAIIMGDTLEHIPADKAQLVIRKLVDQCRYLVVAIPFEMPQEAVHGNEHEAHQQVDLSVEVMAERYPQLMLLALSPPLPGQHRKAIYGKKGLL